jgi:hypothetical protein
LGDYERWDPQVWAPLSRVKHVINRVSFVDECALQICDDSTSEDALALLAAFAGCKILYATERMRVACLGTLRLDLGAMARLINTMPLLTPFEIDVS